MKKIDPRLRYMISQQPEILEYSETCQLPEMVAVLVRCNRSFHLQSLLQAGMNVYSVIKGFYTVVSGEVPEDALPKLNELEFVVQVEASRPMLEELNISGVETGGKDVHNYDIPIKGAGAIVAVVDGGIDYTHPCFLDQKGLSRILYLWDQGAKSEVQQQQNLEEEELFTSDAKVRYGQEYTKADLDKALTCLQQGKNNFELISHTDNNGHGTHVAGIAAGNGFASNGEFTGIAPEADLIVVVYKKEERSNTLGRSARAVDALNYIVQRANSRPVAINISQGMNGGGHSGETVLETAIDNLARQSNVVIVKSAGNEQDKCIHAGGQIAQEELVSLELEVSSFVSVDNILELWYENSEEQQISVALQPPDSDLMPFVEPDEEQHSFVTSKGNKITIYSERNADETGDTVITIIFSKGNASCIQQGKWNLLLRGEQVQQGRYDVWIERNHRQQQIKFSPACALDTYTITTPGNAKRIITVGSYITRPINGYTSPPVEEISSSGISSFSSCGPTRYGSQKPEITAPGEWIISTRSVHCNKHSISNNLHTGNCGTSMAAPHVTGTAALILSVCPGLNCEQVKQILMQTARLDEWTSTLPNHTWGSGKLNVKAAVECARECASNFMFPKISNVQISGATLSWQTDMLTTAIIRFHTEPGKLTLGKHLGQQNITILTNNHTVTLNQLSPGETYYCEIVVFSKDGWWTVDDNIQDQGFAEFYIVQV
ncbi:S8 family serine peptidase [Nostoc sp. 106C]|uniref:S8 family serine peptidase n=1 Tax=Nostoc sp. 106C TaxID=1932667 RepID=UPI000A37E3ED|nr:S8 family serine peptidase [Nostoc sp. 106C]OUL20457.1 hypothetical protein BV375_30870 [Nostoc sp. 106C]OUL25139.1 hypothetical protein BV378_16375 [Nostoc sp. RF31YmG]